MKELIHLAEEIYNELFGTDEQISWDEALDMAKMELNSRKITRYEKSDTPRKKGSRERKVDEEKKMILNLLEQAIHNHADNTPTIKNEAEFSFFWNDNSYTVKLIKHRRPK